MIAFRPVQYFLGNFGTGKSGGGVFSFFAAALHLRFDFLIENQPQSSHHVVKILAGDVVLKIRRTVAALLGRNFIQRVISQVRP